MPLVTVVIPTWNRASLLGVAIASALAQTFRDFDVVVVDDASEDGTAHVVAGFDDPRVRYVRHETRRGGSAARNTGIRASAAPFIAFLDDDDEWMPEKLELQMGLFDRSGPRVGISYTTYLIVDRASGTVLGRKTASFRGNLSDRLRTRNVVGGTSSVIARRECFDRAGFFDETLPSFQDYDLWIRISRHFEFDFLDQPLLKYYVHRKTIWRDPDALKAGLAIMVGKYGDSRSMRRYLGYTALSLGVQYCFDGRCAEGRRAFVQGMRLYPFEFRHYLNFALSFAGPAGYRAIKDAKERFRDAGRWGRANRPTPPSAAMARHTKD